MSLAVEEGEGGERQGKGGEGGEEGEGGKRGLDYESFGQILSVFSEGFDVFWSSCSSSSLKGKGVGEEERWELIVNMKNKKGFYLFIF